MNMVDNTLLAAVISTKIEWNVVCETGTSRSSKLFLPARGYA